MQGKYISNSQIYFVMASFMQMIIFAQLTLFDQMLWYATHHVHKALASTLFFKYSMITSI